MKKDFWDEKNYSLFDFTTIVDGEGDNATYVVFESTYSEQYGKPVFYSDDDPNTDVVFPTGYQKSLSSFYK